MLRDQVLDHLTAELVELLEAPGVVVGEHQLEALGRDLDRQPPAAPRV